MEALDELYRLPLALVFGRIDCLGLECETSNAYMGKQIDSVPYSQGRGMVFQPSNGSSNYEPWLDDLSSEVDQRHGWCLVTVTI